LDGNLIDPETGGLRFTQGAQSFHRVVGAEDGEDTDYLFDGGWWVVERGSATDGFSCEPYEGPEWVDFAEGRIRISAINTYANLREPVCTVGLGPTLTSDCALDFDYVRRATVDGHLLEIGFDCSYAGVGEAWWVLDSVMVANRYYHPPEVGSEDYEEWLVAPMRDLYGDSVYDYVAHVEWVDGEAFVFDIGRVGIDLSLEAFLGGDNCVLLDWFKPQAPSTTTTTSAPTPIVLDEGERLRIVVTGDSITDQIRPYLLDMFGDAAFVERRHHGGTALCDWFAEQAELSLQMDYPLQGTFNYIDKNYYNPDQAIDVMNGVLLTKGFTLIRRQQQLLMVNLDDEIPDVWVEFVPLEELDQRGHYELVKCLFQLDKMTPEEAEAAQS